MENPQNCYYGDESMLERPLRQILLIPKTLWSIIIRSAEIHESKLCDFLDRDS